MLVRLCIGLIACCVWADAWSRDGNEATTSLIAACYSEIRPEVYDNADIDSLNGLPTIGQICPDTAQRVLEHAWHNHFSSSPLEFDVLDLADFSNGYDSYSRLRPKTWLHNDDLPAAMAKLRLEPPAEPSLWEQFLHWVRNWWQANDESSASWLEEFKLSKSVVNAMFYASVTIVLVLTAFIVIRELRAALFPKRDVAERGWDIPQTVNNASAIGFSNLNDTPLTDRPSLLLQIVLRHLVAAGLLKTKASQTHRELAIATTQLPQREKIHELIGAAEQTLFGGWVPEAGDAERLAQIGRDVCDSIGVRI